MLRLWVRISTKCKALLCCRMYYQSIRVDTTTAAWLQEWELIGPLPNPPYVAAYPCTPTYVRMYAMDMAYIPPPNHNETPKLFRKRTYLTLHTMTTATTPTRSLRIETLYPNHNCSQICRNLYEIWIPDMIRSVWYTAIHDIMPTKQRLHRIALTNTDRCDMRSNIHADTPRDGLRRRKSHMELDLGSPDNDAQWTPTTQPRRLDPPP
jgi:hypothetical protein